MFPELRKCQMCDDDVSHMHHLTQYCFACASIRNNASRAKKVYHCRKCGGERQSRFGRYCGTCEPFILAKARNWEFNSGKNEAISIVAKARKAGYLPDLKKENIPCDDCGKRATDYDHRDYQYPLLVDPVCRSCNCKRGKAKPKRDFKEVA